jgi:hypothetical protein
MPSIFVVIINIMPAIFVVLITIFKAAAAACLPARRRASRRMYAHVRTTCLHVCNSNQQVPSGTNEHRRRTSGTAKQQKGKKSIKVTNTWTNTIRDCLDPFILGIEIYLID